MLDFIRSGQFQGRYWSVSGATQGVVSISGAGICSGGISISSGGASSAFFLVIVVTVKTSSLGMLFFSSHQSCVIRQKKFPKLF